MPNNNKLTLPLGNINNHLDVENKQLRNTISVLKSELLKHISLNELNAILSQIKSPSSTSTDVNESGSVNTTLNSASNIIQSYSSNENKTVTPTSTKFVSNTSSNKKMSISPSTLGLSTIINKENVAPPRSRNRQSDSSTSNPKIIDSLQFNHSDVSLTEAIIEEDDDEKNVSKDYYTQNSMRSPVEQDLLKSSDSTSEDSDDEFSLSSLTNKNTDRSVKIKGPDSEKSVSVSRPRSPISMRSPRLLDSELMDFDTFGINAAEDNKLQNSITQSNNDPNQSFSSQFLDIPKKPSQISNNASDLIKENDEITAKENSNSKLDLTLDDKILKPPKSPAPRSYIADNDKISENIDRRDSEVSYNSSIQLSPSPSIMMTPKLTHPTNLKAKSLSPSPDLKPAKVQEENNKPATSTAYTTSRIQIQPQNSLSTIKQSNAQKTPTRMKTINSDVIDFSDGNQSSRSSLYGNSVQNNQADNLLLSPRAQNLHSPRSASKNRHNIIYDNKLHSPMRLEPLDISEIEADLKSLNESEKSQLGIDIVKPVMKKPIKPTKNDSLFVQPNELQNVQIDLLSCIHYIDDPNSKELGFLFRVVDKKSGKNLYEFTKKYEQVVKLLNFLQKYTNVSLDVPLLQKDEEGFVPKQIIGRYVNINNIIKHAVKFGIDSDNIAVLIKFAEFISTNISINTFGNDLMNFNKFNSDNVQIKLENYGMIKKYKTIGSASQWKCRCIGLVAERNNYWMKFLDIRDNIQEGLRISSHTSLEFYDNNEQDLDKYGCYNGFYISENGKKSTIGGSKNNSKFYLSFETREIRDNWIKALYQIIKTGSLNNMELQQKQVYSDVQSIKSEDSNDTTNVSARKYRMRSLFPFNKKDAVSANQSTENLNGERNSISDQTGDSTVILDNNSDNDDLEDNNKIFGNSLHYALLKSSKKYNGHEVPSIIQNCIERLYLKNDYYLKEQGIFRISGSSLTIKNLMDKYDKEYDIDLKTFDIHVVCSLLKTYLRKMPDHGGILSNDRSNSVDVLKKICDQQTLKQKTVIQVLQEMKVVLWNRDAIDIEHFDLCAVFFEMLNKICSKQDLNKMNLRNLIIVFAPTLDLPVDILAHFIRDYNFLFNEEANIDTTINRDDVKVNIPGM